MPTSLSNHINKYASAYMQGFLFFLITIATAFVSEFAPLKDMTQEQISGIHRWGWLLRWAALIVNAGTTMLAFLNQSVSRSNQPSGEPSKPTSAPVIDPNKVV